MIEQPHCPICRRDSWEPLATRHHFRRAVGLSSYVAARYRILFELWAPGREWLTIRFVLCRECGFVMYTPRPTADEVSAKYARLGGATSSTIENPVVTQIDRIRSEELHAAVSEYVPEAGRVLDFGGGTGSLMTRFVDQGFSCAVVDYAPEPIHGVERIAESMAEIPDGRRFDLIIASHVIEHVPSPVETVRSLAARLDAGGILYIEVPHEVVGRAPRRREPVTHINFFSEPSMRELIHYSGLECVRCRTTLVTSGGGRKQLSVGAVARKSDGATRRDVRAGRKAAAEVRRSIHRGIFERAAMMRRFPELLPDPWRKLVGKYGRT